MDTLEDFDNKTIEKLNKSGKITARNITDLFGSDRSLRRTKSVSKLPAQITTLCGPNKHQDSNSLMLSVAARRLRLYDEKLYYIYILQFENALRISEILSVSPSQIDRLGNIMIRGSKKGKSKIISSSEAREYLLMCKANSVCPFAEYNRFYVYRVYRQVGIGVRNNENGRTAVTHAFRHLHAQAAREANFDDSLITEKLGHRNPNTQKHYGTSQPTRKKQA